jgi:hypothetical protein
MARRTRRLAPSNLGEWSACWVAPKSMSRTCHSDANGRICLHLNCFGVPVPRSLMHRRVSPVKAERSATWSPQVLVSSTYKSWSDVKHGRPARNPRGRENSFAGGGNWRGGLLNRRLGGSNLTLAHSLDSDGIVFKLSNRIKDRSVLASNLRNCKPVRHEAKALRSSAAMSGATWMSKLCKRKRPSRGKLGGSRSPELPET